MNWRKWRNNLGILRSPFLLTMHIIKAAFFLGKRDLFSCLYARRATNTYLTDEHGPDLA